MLDKGVIKRQIRVLSNVRQGPFQCWKQVVSNIGKQQCQILCNSLVQRLTRVLPVVRTCKIVYWRLFWSSCFCDGNGRWLVVEGWSNGGRTPRVSIIDHTRKLHTHSVLCGCGGRVVEILQHRACACVHTCTYYITELSHVGKLREVREKLERS